MNSITNVSAAKRERMLYDGVQPILSARKYNLVIGLVLLYGVIVNVLMCIYMAPQIMMINPIVLLIGYMVLAIVGSMIAYKSDSPLISFIGYNMVVIPMGAVLTVCLQGFDPFLILQAFFLTALITAIMTIAASIYPGFFAGMGRMLFVGLIGLLIAQLVCMFLHLTMPILSWVAAALFSLYIGYDWVKAQMYVKTLDNAVDSALDIYLDVINLFLRILEILARRND